MARWIFSGCVFRVPKITAIFTLSPPTFWVDKLQRYCPLHHSHYRGRLPPQPTCFDIHFHPAVRSVRISSLLERCSPSVALGGCISSDYNGLVPCRSYLSSPEGPFPTMYYKYLWPILECLILMVPLLSPMIAVVVTKTCSNEANSVELCGW